MSYEWSKTPSSPAVGDMQVSIQLDWRFQRGEGVQVNKPSLRGLCVGVGEGYGLNKLVPRFLIVT